MKIHFINKRFQLFETKSNKQMNTYKDKLNNNNNNMLNSSSSPFSNSRWEK